MKKKKLNFKAIDKKLLIQEDRAGALHIFLKAKYNLQSKKDFDLLVKHSRHSLKRASQRSFDYDTLLSVLILGTPFYRQGMTFFTVMEDDLLEELDHRLVEKVRNLVVVIGDTNRQIVTCYYAKNAVRHLRRKGKELKRRRAS